MTTTNRNNVLVMQSGGCTPVINRSLHGLVSEASRSISFGKIFGAIHGLEGLLSGHVADLEKTSAQDWDNIAQTPGAALGSTRRKLRDEDIQVIIDSLDANGIGFWFIIGGNDSAETGHSVSEALKGSGHEIAIVNIPKTIDNDLVLTDHSPGYGSAARFVAMATMGAGRDAESMGTASPVTIIELMGRDAGWLPAASAFAKREERDAPHIICLPEFALDEERFIAGIENALSQYGFAVAVISENARGPNGEVIGNQGDPWFVDDFGHKYFDGPARYLAGEVSKRLKVRARYEKPGTIQRSMSSCLSESDIVEAEMVGRAAARYASEGVTDKIVSLVRESDSPYRVVTDLAPLEKVAAAVKTMPEEFLDPANYFVTPQFLSYAKPLIGSELPMYGRISL